MSLPGNVIVANGESSLTFDEVVRDANGVVRNDPSRPLKTPRTLTIKHTMANLKTKGPQIDRHLVSISDTVLDGASQPVTATVNLSLIVPRDYVGNIGDLVTYVHNLLTSNTAAILRGES